MKIYFFEEFPNSSALSKLKLVKFPTKLFLADYSIEGFKLYEKEIKKEHKNVKELIYWPVLNVDEGYWLSPFSKRKALLRLFHQLLNEKIPIMWDAEFPRKRSLMFTQFLKSFRNKALIKSFFKNYKGTIYTAEYLKESNFLVNNCLSFDPREYNNFKIKMLYSSVHYWMDDEYIKNKLNELKRKYGNNLLIGLGCLATGMDNNEKLLSAEQLKRDLRLCKESGVGEVVLFRIGGLNEDYLKVIEKFV